MNKYWIRMILIVSSVFAQEETSCLQGLDFLHGIQAIIGVDPNVPPHEVEYKPFVGSFSTIRSADDCVLTNTSYCMTDNACGHWEAYSQYDVPLSSLSCNSFCFIPTTEQRFVKSAIYTTENPPHSYLNCGWETCG